MRVTNTHLLVGRSKAVGIRDNTARVNRNTSAIFSRVITRAIKIPIDSIHIVSARSASIAPFSPNTFTSHRDCITTPTLHDTTLLLGRGVVTRTTIVLRRSTVGLALVGNRVILIRQPRRPLVSLGSLTVSTFCRPRHNKRLSTRDSVGAAAGPPTFNYAFISLAISVTLYGIAVGHVLGIRSSKRVLGPLLTRNRMRNKVKVNVN